MSRRYLATDPARPFSDAVLVDDHTLYLSGRLGLKPGNQVPETIEEEAHLVMQELRRILALAEMQLSDLVTLTIYCPDVSLWAQFNAVYAQYFPGPLPARAFIGSGPLLFGAHFEIQGIAVKDAAA